MGVSPRFESARRQRRSLPTVAEPWWLSPGQSQSLRTIGTAHAPLPPCLVVQEPADGVVQPLLEIVARPPAELAADLRGVDCIARVMTRAVGHELDQPLVR